MSTKLELSDSLVLDARVAAAKMARDVADQVEFWARLGEALDPLLQGTQVMALAKAGQSQALADLLAEVGTPKGRGRLAAHLAELPYPHYEPYPDDPALMIRVEEDGTRTVGSFIQRVFTPVDHG